MFTKVVTLTEFLLKEEQKIEEATGSFTLLITQVENAAKIIASHVKRTGLVDIIGETGKTNAYDEEVQKLDEFANEILIDMLIASKQVSTLGSEELDELITVENGGDYMVMFDPLDGSSNIDANAPIGTIFSIYRNSKSLPIGKNQIAAGYILYGPSVMFIYATENGTRGFTLDPSIGSFLLSHPDIKIPEDGNIYSINESYFPQYPKYIQDYLRSIKSKEKPLNLRMSAAMVGDVHRILLNGGIFMYTERSKHPEGKLRLLFEVNPMSFIVQKAGGQAISLGEDPLSIQPKKISQRVPIVMGSRKMVDEFNSFYMSS